MRESIRISRDGRVANLTIDRPPLNILDLAALAELRDALVSLAGDDPQLLVLRGGGEKAFSAGVAVEESRSDRVFQMLEAFQSVFRNMLEISKPVVTVVNGPAIGGGCELAALGDLIIATPKARFAQPEIKLGVFPPLASIILPHAIGPKRALEMILTGDPLSAEEALRLGLVTRVVPENLLQQEVDKILAKITEQSAPVLEMAKKVIYETIGIPLQDAIKKSSDIYLNQLMDLDDSQEGLRAIVEKRKPVWKNQ